MNECGFIRACIPVSHVYLQSTLFFAVILLLFLSNGSSSGLVFFAEDHCSGGEESLFQCMLDPHQHQLCSHNHDVGLTCGKNIIHCTFTRQSIVDINDIVLTQHVYIIM